MSTETSITWERKLSYYWRHFLIALASTFGRVPERIQVQFHPINFPHGVHKSSSLFDFAELWIVLLPSCADDSRLMSRTCFWWADPQTRTNWYECQPNVHKRFSEIISFSRSISWENPCAIFYYGTEQCDTKGIRSRSCMRLVKTQPLCSLPRSMTKECLQFYLASLHFVRVYTTWMTFVSLNF